MALKQLQLMVRGRVQGVYFRASTQREARRLGITGWVKNRADGTIEIVAEGEEVSIRELYGWAQKGPTAARVVLEYGDYECPYSRKAFRAIELVERRYAAELQLDVARFDVDRLSSGVLARVRRDVESGLATGAVRGTPTLFIDGVVHLGSYDAPALLEALA